MFLYNFSVVYQDVVDTIADQVVFYESLLRSCVQQDIAAVIQQAEADRSIIAIDCHMLLQGFDIVKREGDVKISVNASTISIEDSYWQNYLWNLLDLNEQCFSRVILEITETSGFNLSQNAHNFLQSCRRRGLKLAMDDIDTVNDFGKITQFLQIGAVDLLKIGRGLISKVEMHEGSQKKLQQIVDIAHKNKIPVVAEGVEKLSQSIFLQNMGLNLQQGYYFSYPSSVRVKSLVACG